MLFISAGHHNNDTGAVNALGVQENNLTIQLRNKVIAILKAKKMPFINDNDDENLATYLRRIIPGNASVTCEFHFDMANTKASGSTAIVAQYANKNSIAFADELSSTTAKILGIKNRGVKSETETNRGRLGLMRKDGIVALLEVCFIDNVNDMASYTKNIDALAAAYADILMKYENLIN